MDKNEYQNFTNLMNSRQIGASELVNQKPRTLLYGYDSERSTIHVFLDREGRFRRIEYNLDTLIMDRTWDHVSVNVLTHGFKRLYPERCDLEFCKLVLLHRGAQKLPFTTYQDDVEPADFYGRIE